MELLPDEPLGLALVRRDEERLRFDTEPQRLPLAIERRCDVSPREVTNRLGVEVVLDVARQRAGEDDEVGALGQVVELLAQHLELLRLHRGPPLVDLGVGVAGRVDHRRRRPRLALDADEVVEDRLAGEALDDAKPGLAAGKTGGDDGDAEQLERARDVQPLPARERQARAGAVAPPPLKVRDGDGARERGIERDGDDHVIRSVVMTRSWGAKSRAMQGRRERR